MLFIIILMFSSLSISLCAGYFSVYGLANIFTGAFWPVVIMGSALELGKLVSASYVYKFWNKINFILKSYLILSIMILMIITSMGIFGFLSSAYQQDSIPLKEIEQTIILLKSEKTDIIFRKRQIDADIAALPSNFVSGRERLMKQYGPELIKINIRLDVIASETLLLSKDKLNQEAHTGPIIYIAKVFGKDVDNAIKYMILLLVLVFDPLAVILVISTNIAIKEYKKSKNNSSQAESEVIDSKPNNILDTKSEDVIHHIISKNQITNQLRSNK